MTRFEMNAGRIWLGDTEIIDYVRSVEMDAVVEFTNVEARFTPVAERLGWAPRPSLPPGTDILDLIDDTMGERCACGCGTPIGPGSDSVWYATPECQRRFLERDTDRPHEVHAAPDAALVYPGSDQARWRPEPQEGEGPATGGLVSDWVTAQLHYEFTSWQRLLVDCAMSGNAYALFGTRDGSPQSVHAYGVGFDMEATDWSSALGHAPLQIYFDEVTFARVFRISGKPMRTTREPFLRRIHTETSRRQRARRRRR